MVMEEDKMSDSPLSEPEPLQGEEKKELDKDNGEDNSDWQASVRGLDTTNATTTSSKNKRRKGNRGSLDGTRRFRKVVTFRNSLVQTRFIAGRRRRGRNSLLPWFSSSAQEHTQEVLDQQEQQRQEEEAEKAARKLAKKEEKAKKKKEKQAKKMAKKMAKKEKKDNRARGINLKEEDNNNLNSQPLVFEDTGTDDEPDNVVEDKPSRRRRSSISTAILDTMRTFASRKQNNKSRVPRHTVTTGNGTGTGSPPRQDMEHSQSHSNTNTPSPHRKNEQTTNGTHTAEQQTPQTCLSLQQEHRDHSNQQEHNGKPEMAIESELETEMDPLRRQEQTLQQGSGQHRGKPTPKFDKKEAKAQGVHGPLADLVALEQTE